MFSTRPKTNFSFSVTFILSSASAFNLDQSKNLSFGKWLRKMYCNNRDGKMNQHFNYRISRGSNYLKFKLPEKNNFTFHIISKFTIQILLWLYSITCMQRYSSHFLWAEDGKMCDKHTIEFECWFPFAIFVMFYPYLGFLLSEFC